MGYVDIGKGRYPGSPLHNVLVERRLAREVWGTDELPGEPALDQIHARIMDAVAISERFPHEPAVLQLSAHGRPDAYVRCVLRYSLLGHVAGLCLELER